MKFLFLSILIGFNLAQACLSEPVYIEIGKAEKSISAEGRHLILRHTKELAFETQMPLSFEPLEKENLDGLFGYRIGVNLKDKNGFIKHAYPLTGKVLIKVKSKVSRSILLNLTIPEPQKKRSSGCGGHSKIRYN